LAFVWLLLFVVVVRSMLVYVPSKKKRPPW
jgi:hypothetical protein